MKNKRATPPAQITRKTYSAAANLSSPAAQHFYRRLRQLVIMMMGRGMARQLCARGFFFNAQQQTGKVAIVNTATLK